jgi:hypothetical protein
MAGEQVFRLSKVLACGFPHLALEEFAVICQQCGRVVLCRLAELEFFALLGHTARQESDELVLPNTPPLAATLVSRPLALA